MALGARGRVEKLSLESAKGLRTRNTVYNKPRALFSPCANTISCWICDKDLKELSV